MENSITPTILPTNFDLRFKTTFAQDPSDKYDYFETIKSKNTLTGESALWYSALEQAVWDYTNHYDFKATFDWFYNSKNEGIGSFLYICNVLDIEPSTILKSLCRWTKRNLR